MSANTSIPAWKRIIVFLLGFPGYLVTFMPWLFVIALVLYASISFAQNDYVVFVVEDFSYESITSNIGTVLASMAVSAGLWIFIAWLTKRLLLIIAQLLGGSEKTWQITKLSALFGGWLVVFILAQFVFHVVVPGFLLSLVFVNSVGVLSFLLEYLGGKFLIKKA